MPGPPEEALIDRSMAETMNRYVQPSIESGARDIGRVLGKGMEQFMEGTEEAFTKTVENLPDLLREGGKVVSLWLSEKVGQATAETYSKGKKLPKKVLEEAQRTGLESLKHTTEQWERDFQRRHGRDRWSPGPKPTRGPAPPKMIFTETSEEAMQEVIREMQKRTPEDWRRTFEDMPEDMMGKIKETWGKYGTETVKRRRLPMTPKDVRAITEKVRWERMNKLQKIRTVLGRNFWKFTSAIEKVRNVAAWRAGKLVVTLVNTYGWAPLLAHEIGGALNYYYDQRIEEGAIDKPILRQINEANQRIRARDNATRN